MTLTKVAILLSRFVAVNMMIDLIIGVTYLPDRLFLAANARTSIGLTSYWLEAGFLIFRCIFYLFTSLFFWFGAKSIAKKLAKDLEDSLDTTEQSLPKSPIPELPLS